METAHRSSPGGWRPTSCGYGCFALLILLWAGPARAQVSPAQTATQAEPQSQDDTPKIIVTTREVTVLFRAVDREGVPVSGLTRSDIQILDEGEPPPRITSFESDVSHAQVVVLADVSGSMGGVVEVLQGALYAFADLLARDRARESGDVLLSLIPFSETVVPLIDRTPSPTRFKDAVSRLHTMGSTALVDAVLASARNAFRSDPQEKGVKRFKFLVVFTDSGENASRHRWPELASVLNDAGVVIYSVGFVSGASETDFRPLEQIAHQTGGRLLQAQAEDLVAIYSQIASDIRSYYMLTFPVPSLEDPRRWRSIKVTAKRSGVTIYARSGYCPEEPCQKPDGSFVGPGKPRDFSGVVELNENRPLLVTNIKQRLRKLRFRYDAETERILGDMVSDALLVQRAPDPGNPARPHFTPAWASQVGKQVDIDAEVCGIRIAPQSKGSSINLTPEPLPDTSGRSEFVVVSPELRVAQGAVVEKPEIPQPSVHEVPYFKGVLNFYLKDPSGRIPSLIEIKCDRPHYLVTDELVDLAIGALESGLRLKVLGR